MSVIAVDAMGGDFAPRTAVEGAVQAVREAAADVLLVGDAAQIEPLLSQQRVPAGRVHVHHTPESVSMTDAATVVLREKPRASVREGSALLRQGQVQGLVSAGHSGAAMVAAKHELGMVPGIDRPAIATRLPQRHGTAILLDSGANVDCRPQYLVQFARMGALYAQRVLNVAEPRVALLSNGGEAGKGNELVRQTHALLQEWPQASRGPRYVGNIEGRELFRGRADVVITDGFVGNLVLKVSEAAGSQVRLLLREGSGRTLWGRLGRLLLRGIFLELARRTDYREIGGSPLLGLQGVCIVAHGSSTPSAIANAVHEAERCVQVDLVGAMARMTPPTAAGAE